MTYRYLAPWRECTSRFLVSDKSAKFLLSVLLPDICILKKYLKLLDNNISIFVVAIT